jgi:exopolysaccharide production protein ExoZ
MLAMKNKTFWSLQAGRGIASVIVVLHHCSAYFGTDPRFWRMPAYTTFFRFGALGVNFFFVLSGIVIFLAHRKDFGQPGRIGRFVKKRLLRIYPIYWVVLAVVVMTFYAHPEAGNSSQHSLWALLSSIALIHLNSTAAVLGVAWSLFAEILFYAVFSLLLLHRRLGTVALLVWFSVCAFQAAHNFSLHPVLSLYVSPWHLLFGVGMLVAMAITTPSAKRLPFRGILAGGCFLLFLACVLCDLRGPKIVSVYLFGGVASAVLIFGLMLAEEHSRVSVPSWLRYLGDASYSIYLIHFPLLSFISRPVYRIATRWPLVPLPLWFIVESAIAVLGGLALHQFVERRLLQLGRPSTVVTSQDLLSSRST